MNRSSRYYTLEHTVHVYGHCGFAGWETIAAFNAHSVAVAYALECKRANGRREGVRYGVSSRKGNAWGEVKEV